VKASVRTIDDVDLVVAAYVAGQHVPLTEEERNAAVRRALFVFAAGGDLHREPTLEDPAVLELASDLDSAERRDALLDASELLRQLDDPDLAWRAYACGLLADALGEEEDVSEKRFEDELEEPGDPVEEQEDDEPADDADELTTD
jgi:hypothetical protein